MLKKYFITLFFFSSALLAQQQRDTSITIEQILSLPEDNIDIGLADLVLAKDFYPTLNIDYFLYCFGYMVERYKEYYGGITDPDKRVRALNTYLYKKGRWNDSISFGYDDDDLGVTKLSNKFINGYIATKKGSCITLPMMYVILGERLGYPIFVSRLPYHFFIRYVPERRTAKFQENIEATNGGGFASNKQYQKDFKVPDKAIKNGVYLRTLTKKGYIASLLLVNSNEWLARKNYEKAKYYLELIFKYDTTFSSAYRNYASLHFVEAKQLEEKMWQEKQDEIAYYNLSTNKVSYSSTPTQQQPNLPQPNYDMFRSPLIDNQTKTIQPKQAPQPEQRVSQSPVNNDLSISLANIETKYAPQILADLDVYHRFKKNAEDLGIVNDYPMIFFQNKSLELKEFQKIGAK